MSAMQAAHVPRTVPTEWLNAAGRFHCKSFAPRIGDGVSPVHLCAMHTLEGEGEQKGGGGGGEGGGEEVEEEEKHLANHPHHQESMPKSP